MTVDASAIHSKVASPASFFQKEWRVRNVRIFCIDGDPGSASTNQSRSTMGFTTPFATGLLLRGRCRSWASSIRLNGADNFAADGARGSVELSLNDDDGADGKNNHRSRKRHPFERHQTLIVTQEQPERVLHQTTLLKQPPERASKPDAIIRVRPKLLFGSGGPPDAVTLRVGLDRADDLRTDRAGRRVHLRLDDDDNADRENDHSSSQRDPLKCHQAFFIAQKAHQLTHVLTPCPIVSQTYPNRKRT